MTSSVREVREVRDFPPRSTNPYAYRLNLSFGGLGECMGKVENRGLHGLHGRENFREFGTPVPGDGGSR